MSRARITYPLLLGVLLGASLPALFVVQYFVDRSRETVRHLGVRLEIRVEGQDALIMATDLLPAGPAAKDDSLFLAGKAPLLAGKFPWDPTPFEARVTLHLSSDLLANGPGEYPTGWAASYSERRLSRKDDYGLPPIPCMGLLVVKSISGRIGPKQTLGDLHQLDIAMDLRCTSAGSDLVWDTTDDRTWTLEGPATLRAGSLR